jgi:hypothetical protein
VQSDCAANAAKRLAIGARQVRSQKPRSAAGAVNICPTMQLVPTDSSVVEIDASPDGVTRTSSIRRRSWIISWSGPVNDFALTTFCSEPVYSVAAVASSQIFGCRAFTS